MKTLDELLHVEEPAWPLVHSWIEAATNEVEVLEPPSETERRQSLLETQVTVRSPMGAVVYQSGGLLVEGGWLRVLGAGNERLPRSLPLWNRRCVQTASTAPPFLLVADDAVGGFFAIDGGGLLGNLGNVCYFAPDTLAWEDTHLNYSRFLGWVFNGNLELFYRNFRWTAWRSETAQLRGDQAFSFYPPLWNSGTPLEERSRRAIDITEIYDSSVGSQTKS